MKDDEGGSAAIDFKAPRRCIYCLERQATPDTLSCAECMRGLAWPNMADLAHLQNAWNREARRVAVYMPNEIGLTRWQRFKRWLRSIRRGNAPQAPSSAFLLYIEYLARNREEKDFRGLRR